MLYIIITSSQKIITLSQKKKSQFLALEIEKLCINLIQLIEKAVSSRPATHPQDFRQ